tara:strand:- start:320 stop:556 length:237 start_codon:yes stop_codon:yes gene_type:complete
MATDVTVLTPITTDGGANKIVPCEAKVSDETIDHDGKQYRVVKHNNSGFQYLTTETADDLNGSELEEKMNDLATEEGM